MKTKARPLRHDIKTLPSVYYTPLYFGIVWFAVTENYKLAFQYDYAFGVN